MDHKIGGLWYRLPVMTPASLSYYMRSLGPDDHMILVVPRKDWVRLADWVSARGSCYVRVS